MIAKQQQIKEQTYPVCLHIVEKYEKVTTITQTTEKQVKNEQIKRKQTCSLCVCKYN